MKLLFVATFAFPDHFGGAERVITDVATRLAGRGHQVTLLTGRVEGCAERETRDGVQVVRYALDRSSPVRFYRSVWRGVRGALDAGVGAEADLLSVHQMLSGVAALAPGGSPVRARLTSFYAPYSLEYLARWRGGLEQGAVPTVPRAIAAVLRRGDRTFLRRAQQVLVLSRFSLEQVRELEPEAVPRTTVAPAGVDLQRFAPADDAAARAAIRRRLGLPDDGRPLLLSVRRLVPRMGLEDLLEAAARLVAAGQDPLVALAGAGESRQDLEQLAGRLGLAERVHFLGRVPDDVLPDLYRAADVFVLPTRSLEGFGMVTAEALASGLPVVGTRAGATAELLAEVPGAALVEPADPAGLAAALTPLVDDPATRDDARDSARRHAETRLSWDVHLDAFEAAAARAREAAAR